MKYVHVSKFDLGTHKILINNRVFLSIFYGGMTHCYFHEPDW